MKIIKILKDWLISSFHKRNNDLEACTLGYIPERLHTNDKVPIQSFFVDELLYFRCNPDILSNPYNSITLAELSHNRRGDNATPLSEAADVLFNIRPDKEFEIHNDKVVCTIKIIDLLLDQYDKSFSDDKNDIARIKLLHDPVPCMYPHCFFRVWYNDEIATLDNKIHKKHNQLRNRIKHEFASMIYTETLSQTG